MLEGTRFNVAHGAAAALAAMAIGCAGAAEREFEYRAVAGDTLIGLGSRFLADPRDWAVLGKRNRISNPHAIPVGTVIRIPLDRMRHEPRAMQVEAVRGGASGESGALRAGARLAEGSQVATGEDGFVTLRLADGSRVTVPSSSRVQIERSRTYGNESVAETVFRLLVGRVQAEANRLRPADSFTVRARNAATGIRGTRFRVAALEDGGVATEVTEGAVSVAGGEREAIEVPRGFGTRVETDGATLRPVPLLPAPDLAKVPERVERPLVRLPFAAVEGSRAYRAQVGIEAGFRTPVAEGVFAAPEAKFAELADGAYFVRVRAVDRLGLEGLEAERAFTLKARPEPPLVSAPSNRSKHPRPGPALKWSTSTEAATYRVQVASNPAFTAPIVDQEGLADTTVEVASRLSPGQWYWRLASTRADGDRGPWGDPSTFTILPDPPAPKAGPAPGGGFAFEWSGEPGQRFHFQLASDPAFTRLVLERELAEPRLAFPRPGWGDYYFRVRSIDSDGFQGPYGAAQRLEVPFNAWWLLLVVVPLLL